MSLGGSLVQISPTYLSTDLLTPTDLQRFTLPQLGYKFKRCSHPPSIWGTEATQYGGVGNLRLNNQQCKGNQVIISRSHRHYGSGLNGVDMKKDTTQPYAVTSLKLSTCRTSDQLMTPPLLSSLMEEEKLDEPWPEHLRNLFTSQICQYDVFPRFDPVRNQFDVPLCRRVKQELGPATTRALERLNRQIYQTTIHQSTYDKTWTHTRPCVQVPVGSGIDTMKYDTENELLNEREKEEVKEEEEERVEKEGTTDDEQDKHDACTEAMWPVWPPGVDNITNAPPGYPKLWIPRYTPKRYTLIPGWERIFSASNRSHDRRGLNQNGVVKKMDKSNIPLASASQTAVNSNLACRNLSCMRLPTIRNRQEMKDGEKNERKALRLPCITGSTDSTCSPNRKVINIPELGLRFKSEAHKRYHVVHPETTPDLRESTRTGKQHFFGGVHASILR